MEAFLTILQEHWPRYLSGTWLTIQLVVISAILGVLLAVPLALARLSANPRSAASPPATRCSSAARRCSCRSS